MFIIAGENPQPPALSDIPAYAIEGVSEKML